MSIPAPLERDTPEVEFPGHGALIPSSTPMPPFHCSPEVGLVSCHFHDGHDEFRCHVGWGVLVGVFGPWIFSENHDNVCVELVCSLHFP